MIRYCLWLGLIVLALPVSTLPQVQRGQSVTITFDELDLSESVNEQYASKGVVFQGKLFVGTDMIEKDIHLLHHFPFGQGPTRFYFVDPSNPSKRVTARNINLDMKIYGLVGVTWYNIHGRAINSKRFHGTGRQRICNSGRGEQRLNRVPRILPYLRSYAGHPVFFRKVANLRSIAKKTSTKLYCGGSFKLLQNVFISEVQAPRNWLSTSITENLYALAPDSAFLKRANNIDITHGAFLVTRKAANRDLLRASLSLQIL